ncbi:MAG: hypothetical protein L0Y71_04315 [Gemmataceae bacterium]|nr:hypothetical protein [Gemmataceae bacterium]
MSTKFCAASLALVVIAGFAAGFAWRQLARPRPDAATGARSKTSPLESWPPPARPQPKAPAATAVARAAVVETIHEPIVTRPEPLTANEGPSIPVEKFVYPAATGAVAERDVAAAPAPRPDRDTRRMPYADEDNACELSPVIVWLATPLPALAPQGGVVMSLTLPRRPSPQLAEESVEPPVFEEALPARYHPLHCPYGGHCPYPNPYR